MIELDETTSTNTFLRDYRPLTPVAITLVTADHQTAGRGQAGHSWESERGQNLLFSLLVQPTLLPSAGVFVLSEAIALSIRGAICDQLRSAAIALPVTVKWPNDIYVGDRKIAGILIENTLKGNHIKDSIIGIGLNVNQQEFLSDAPNPVSLCQLLGHEVDRMELLTRFLQRKPLVSPAETDGFSYRNRIYRKGQLATYQDKDGRFKATIQDVEPDGHLLMMDEAGQERRYAFKEVTYIL
jgi:BirA family biotin operon repressor/biotin-[acetyl-CoA-carboxylase] ligase